MAASSTRNEFFIVQFRRNIFCLKGYGPWRGSFPLFVYDNPLFIDNGIGRPYSCSILANGSVIL